MLQKCSWCRYHHGIGYAFGYWMCEKCLHAFAPTNLVPFSPKVIRQVRKNRVAKVEIEEIVCGDNLLIEG